MRLYYAPMEGITTCFYRQIHHSLFPGIDRYYTPFIGIYAGHTIKKRDEREIAPENNEGIELVPQILTNKADDFLWLYKKLYDMGYKEINLNLGCPSGTVSGKGRGSGFLRYPEQLDQFLYTVFDALGEDALGLSIKTRLGFNDASEMEHLSEIYAKYPVKELTIHPRIRKQFYNGVPDMDAFDKALAAAKCPVCYNGNIFEVKDYDAICQKYGDTASDRPKIESVMLGRGIVADPSLARQIRGGAPASKEEYRQFCRELEAMYHQELTTDKNVFFKMKELWSYMAQSFQGSDKHIKAMLKSKNWPEFKAAENALLSQCELGGVFEKKL